LNQCYNLSVFGPYVSRKSSQAEPSSGRPYRFRWQLISLPLLLFIAVPLVALIVRTDPLNFRDHLRDPITLQAISVSLKTSLLALFLIVLTGTPVAYFLARKLIPLPQVIDTIIDLPIVLPPAVAGVALLMAFGRRGLLGGWLELIGITIPFTQVAVIMAQVFIAAPLFVKSAVLGFSAVDAELEQAASLDGASHWQIFRYIVAPLSWRALLSGSMMSWARALGEFGATIIFAGNYPGRTQTMPLAIYMGFNVDLDIALALSVILVGFSFLVLMVVKLLLRDNPE
jgi:molybdate transport system permease protein